MARISAYFRCSYSRTENPGVGGSIPSLPTSFLALFHDTGRTSENSALTDATISIPSPRFVETCMVPGGAPTFYRGLRALIELDAEETK